MIMRRHIYTIWLADAQFAYFLWNCASIMIGTLSKLFASGMSCADIVFAGREPRVPIIVPIGISVRSFRKAPDKYSESNWSKN